MKWTVPSSAAAVPVARSPAFGGEAERGAEQHHGMAVMATGMHAARELGRVGPRAGIDRLRHGERVHIRPEADAAPAHACRRAPKAQRGDDAGPADPGRNVQACAAQPIGDETRRALLLEAELGMGVQIEAPCAKGIEIDGEGHAGGHAASMALAEDWTHQPIRNRRRQPAPWRNGSQDERGFVAIRYAAAVSARPVSARSVSARPVSARPVSALGLAAFGPER